MRDLTGALRKLGVRLEVVEFVVDPYKRFIVEFNRPLKKAGDIILQEYAEREGWVIRTGGHARDLEL